MLQACSPVRGGDNQIDITIVSKYTNLRSWWRNFDNDLELDFPEFGPPNELQHLYCSILPGLIYQERKIALCVAIGTERIIKMDGMKNDEPGGSRLGKLDGILKRLE